MAHPASGSPSPSVAGARAAHGAVPRAGRVDWLTRWGPGLVLVGLVVAFSLANPRFFDVSNFARISIAAVPALMVALGVSFVILMGSIDLSMEGAVSTVAVTFALIFNALGGSMLGWGWLAIPLAIVIGAAVGWVNGLIHVKLKIPSFMASLAIGFVGMGLSVVLTSGDILRVSDDVFRSLLFTRVLGFPLMAYAALLIVLAAWFVQRNTTLGRNLYAIGGGEDLAHASGLRVKRIRVAAFALAGVFYALGALFAVARGGMAESLTGTNYMFSSITAVVVGGTSLMGGVGGVWNTVIGVLIVFVISNGMVVIGLPNYLQDGVLGVLVILAVVLSTRRRGALMVK